MARQNDVLANYTGTDNTQLTLTAGVANDYATQMSPAFLLIQNIGTNPIKVRLKESVSGSAAAANYTIVLAAGSTDEDGQGGTVQLSGFTGYLSFLSTSGSKVNIARSGRQGD
jgi:hypothetical protein